MSGRYEVLTGVGSGGAGLAEKVTAALAAGATPVAGVSIAVGTTRGEGGQSVPVVIYAQAVEWPTVESAVSETPSPLATDQPPIDGLVAIAPPAAGRRRGPKKR